MVNVIVMSKLLHEGGFFFSPRKFPEAPQVDDFVDLISFVKDEVQTEIKDYLKSRNKLFIGTVNSRTWGYDQDELCLYVAVEFDDVMASNTSDISL